MEQQNSRFITYPSLVDKSENHTVTIVDATPDDIENIGFFLKSTDKNFDVYLYRGDLNDLEYLSHASDNSDHILVSSASQVTITNATNVTTFGQGANLNNPLKYFKDFDEQRNSD